jgi:hypothetical protein
MTDAPKPKRTISGTVVLPMAQRAVFIATPAYGATFAGDYVRSLFMLLRSKHRVPTEFLFHYFDYADVVVARNYLISDFYFNHPQCTHLLFLDDDMGFDASLITGMLDLGEPLVGTIYPKRKLDLKKLHAAGGQPFEKALAQSLEFIGDERRPRMQKSGFISVTQCGTGIMLISRGCIDEMVRKVPDIVDETRYKRMPFSARFKSFITPFDKIKTGDIELSEDFSFCRRWVEGCGGTIWARPDADIRHIGQMSFAGKYTDR